MGKNYGYNKWTEQEEDFVLENAKAFDGTFTVAVSDSSLLELCLLFIVTED